MRALRIMMVCLGLFSVLAGGLAGCNALNGKQKDPTAAADEAGSNDAADDKASKAMGE